jgi:DNA-binding MarR family transcriptional regulator
MAQEGLVERAQCDTDRRVVYARLTPKGRDVFESSMPVVRAGVAEYLTSPLTESELATLRAALLKIADRAEAPAQAV